MLFEVAEVIELGTAIPVLDEGDTRVDWLGLFEVGEVKELGTAIRILDEGDPLVD